MTQIVSLTQDFVSGIVFGNGWLAFGAIAVVGLLTVLVRRAKGFRV